MTLAEAVETIKRYCKKTDCADDECPFADGDRCLLKRSTPNLWQIPPEKNIYDEVETHENCTVQILRNSVTGEESVGWWEND